MTTTANVGTAALGCPPGKARLSGSHNEHSSKEQRLKDNVLKGRPSAASHPVFS
ncbi:MAG: hypothetical protein WA474_10355 [Candidatus Sulfotelmatobacter sp.]